MTLWCTEAENEAKSLIWDEVIYTVFTSALKMFCFEFRVLFDGKLQHWESKSVLRVLIICVDSRIHESGRHHRRLKGSAVGHRHDNAPHVPNCGWQVLTVNNCWCWLSHRCAICCAILKLVFDCLREEHYMVHICHCNQVCTASPAWNVLPFDLLCRWSDRLELTTRQCDVFFWHFLSLLASVDSLLEALWLPTLSKWFQK